jgi:hypothetical protein
MQSHVASSTRQPPRLHETHDKRQPLDSLHSNFQEQQCACHETAAAINITARLALPLHSLHRPFQYLVDSFPNIQPSSVLSCSNSKSDSRRYACSITTDSTAAHPTTTSSKAYVPHLTCRLRACFQDSKLQPPYPVRSSLGVNVVMSKPAKVCTVISYNACFNCLTLTLSQMQRSTIHRYLQTLLVATRATKCSPSIIAAVAVVVLLPKL